MEPAVAPGPDVVRRRPSQQRSRERFDALVEAGGVLIARRGLDPVSMTDIANEAGLSLTAAYRYFPNKTALVRELAIQVFESDAAMAIELAEQGDRTLDEWIRYAVTTYCNAVIDDAQRRQLRAAVQADAELAARSFADSQATARLIADSLVGAGCPVEVTELEQRALLVVELLDGALNLARSVSSAHAHEVIARFARVASWTLLHEE